MKKKWLAMLLAVVLAIGLLPGTAWAADLGGGSRGLSLLSSGGGSGFSVSITGTQAYAFAYQVADQVNQLRAGLGLSQLVIDPVLMETAMQRAAECAVYYSHTRPNGADCFTAFPSRSWTTVAENIAAGFNSPDAVMTGWTNSPGHYANMTNSGVNAIGVGCFYINGTYYWAQCFTGGAYSDSSSRLSDRTATAAVPAAKGYVSLEGGTGAISLRVGESCQLPVYSYNLEFYNRAAAVNGISGAALSAGTELVTLNSDTLTVTAVAAGSGTVSLRLPDGSTLPFTVQVAGRFPDTPDWCSAAADWGAAQDIVLGVGGGLFGTLNDCTNAEILTFLWRANGRPSAARAPVAAAPYYQDFQDAINWAYENGMIDGAFVSNAPCTRAAAVKYIWQARGSESAPASGFTDVFSGADYYDAVNWADANGIAAGTGGSAFSPDETCTRGEIVTFLHRAYVPEARLK